MYIVRFLNGDVYKGSIADSWEHAKNLLASFIKDYGYSGDEDYDFSLIRELIDIPQYDDLGRYDPGGYVCWIYKIDFGSEIDLQ